jgi:hypothetical protein
VLPRYRNRFAEPKCKEEAAIQQFPDFELLMINLAEKWAQIPMVDTNNAIRFFKHELDEAQKHQKQLKSKANYKYVEYPFKRERSDDAALAKH